MGLSPRKVVVQAYFEGFRRGDHEGILRLLTDDVVWDLPGYRHLVGKEGFDGEIENENFEGRPTLVLDRLVQEDNTVVAIGSGEASRRDGVLLRFAYADVFTFTGDLIGRVESYLVPLTNPAETAPEPR